MSHLPGLRASLRFPSLGPWKAPLWVLAAWSLLALAGCSASPSPAPQASGASAPLAEELDPEFTPDKMAFDDQAPQSKVFEMVEDEEVHVGDSLLEVFQLYPRPRLSFPMTEPPPGISERFTVKGWESRLGAVGFIGSAGRLALLLEIQDQADEGSIRERVELAKRLHGPPTAQLEKGKIRYWFWEDGLARKMICASPDPQGRISLAIALGHPALMTALRMSPGMAQLDVEEASALLQRSPLEAGKTAEAPAPGGASPGPTGEDSNPPQAPEQAPSQAPGESTAPSGEQGAQPQGPTGI